VIAGWAYGYGASIADVWRRRPTSTFPNGQLQPYVTAGPGLYIQHLEGFGTSKTHGVPRHAMLVTAYHLLARKTAYHDPGADYYEHRHAERVRHRAVQLLERQGYRVILEPAA
jgi:hypothetical protein